MYMSEIFMLDGDNWNFVITKVLVMGKQISSHSFNNEIIYNLFTYKS